MSYFTAKMLKEARNNAGLSQEDVAAVLKISKRKVAAMEKDENPILVDDRFYLIVMRLYSGFSINFQTKIRKMWSGS